MDRREFTALMPALFAMLPSRVLAQGGTIKSPKIFTSGVYKPGPVKAGSQAKHVSRAFGSGMLKAGDIRLEMHESTQEAGAEHEAVGTHVHNEIWFITKGSASLFINGTEHAMEAGDVGLVCAGDQHWIRNSGTGDLSYFVLAVGPPE